MDTKMEEILFWVMEKSYCQCVDFDFDALFQMMLVFSEWLIQEITLKMQVGTIQNPYSDWS